MKNIWHLRKENHRGIYAFYSKSINRVYIGQSERLGSRKARHIGDLKRKCHDNNFLQNHVNKYGLCDLEYVLLYEANYIENLTYLEALQIKSHLSLGFSLFNLGRVSDSIANSKETSAKHTANQRRLWDTQEHRDMMSEAIKRCWAEDDGDRREALAKRAKKLFTDPNKVKALREAHFKACAKKVAIFQREVLLGIFDSTEEAAKATGISGASISRYANKVCKSHKGYRAEYV